MQIESPVFGSIDVPDDKLISFPAGLPGFEDCKLFALLHPDAAQPRVFYLQSVEDPGIAFSIASPDQFGLHYEFSLSDDELAMIGLDSADKAAVMVILRRDNPDDANSPVRAVLTAPLVINLESRKGIQKPIANIGCDITLRSND
ncbi:flagellar assembly protein FliW [Niveibacterium sp. 24ML]|uniref:flagellar assembly protein FliW n=1 Tax=Niveibacterium sp. 24ML TaxID=2985512 RepID=UPI00226D5B8C|nr:flagellar assembly protein FliW [Niveibacterium sp. 24ML]MCX9156895.1 flagellar assembly protein FliW [Niveibacterium sp. 24ML]